MSITVYNFTPVSADVDLDMLARYLIRTGWELYGLHSSTGLMTATWARGRDTIRIFGPGIEDQIARFVDRLAEYEGRQPGDVLLDIAGARRDLGRLINAKATWSAAGAKLVEAREAMRQAGARIA